jgi:hypothetical protein
LTKVKARPSKPDQEKTTTLSARRLGVPDRLTGKIQSATHGGTPRPRSSVGLASIGLALFSDQVLPAADSGVLFLVSLIGLAAVAWLYARNGRPKP